MAFTQASDSGKTGTRRDRNKQGRKVSDQSSSQTSPSRRKDSITKRDRYIYQNDNISDIFKLFLKIITDEIFLPELFKMIPNQTLLNIRNV